ncbi:hypothetical protein [Clostridium kluyveri]|uniref:Uncharacterized protein n=1 Tax=Clostridium kluyveri TaxID=1534 RepID=A0A1L5F2U3_CLOKL|nr:hypothetical protein [Clostridium kluyveri]APM37329.1 hypothetical protein BS101_00385 [Clostridium kluyveri]UZQ49812.1 hypothetical protein OP486_17975 [Clostridium kluyveri]
MSKLNGSMKSLEKVCKPVVDYIRDNYNPHVTVVITDSQIKLLEDKMSIPIESDGREDEDV